MSLGLKELLYHQMLKNVLFDVENGLIFSVYTFGRRPSTVTIFIQTRLFKCDVFFLYHSASQETTSTHFHLQFFVVLFIQST